MDLSQFIIESDSAPQAQTEPKGTYRNTGIEYFDKKEFLSPFDALIAREAGIDISMRHDVDLKARTLSGNKSIQSIFENIQGLDTINEAVTLANKKGFFDNAGVRAGLVRKLHNLTGGATPISDESMRLNSLDNKIIYNLGKAEVGGRPSNQVLDDMKGAYGLGFRNEKEMNSRYGQAMESTLLGLKNQIAEHYAKGFDVPPQVWLEMNKYEQKVKYLREVESGAQKFDEKAWRNQGYGEYFEFHRKQKDDEKKGLKKFGDK